MHIAHIAHYTGMKNLKFKTITLYLHISRILLNRFGHFDDSMALITHVILHYSPKVLQVKQWTELQTSQFCNRSLTLHISTQHTVHSTLLIL